MATSTLTTATTTTTTASGVPSQKTVSSVTSERDSEERIIRLKRSSSRCSRGFSASDCIKRASISEAFSDEYVQLYLSPGLANISTRSDLTNTGLDDLCNRKFNGPPVSLSSGSSMTSMSSLTPSEDSMSCLCRAYRQFNLRSVYYPEVQQGSNSVRMQMHSSNCSSQSNATNDSSYCSTISGSIHAISASDFLTDDTLIPCLCGPNCEKNTSKFSSNSLYQQYHARINTGSGSIRGDDSGIGSISSRSNYSARTSTPLSSGSSELSMASSATSEDYRNLSATMALLDNPNSVVRRVQSFTGMVKAKAAIIQHTLSFRHSPTMDLPTLSKHRCPGNGVAMSCSGSRTPHHNYSYASISSTDSSTTRLASSTSLEELSPTSPAAWLRKQEKHFPAAGKKGGSLPRSFETTAFV